MANRNDYTNKEKVIAKFNESVEHANSYFAHASDDHSHETFALLNAAGSELYECFENGMKYVIVKHFEQLVQKGVRIEKNRIEKRVKGKTRYQLIQEIKKIGIPQLNGDNIYTVNFDKLDGNADVVCNRKKHELKNVDPIKYEESLSEVRKFLLAYVDGKAKLNILDTKGAYDIFQMEYGAMCLLLIPLQGFHLIREKP